jgi:hypothetical protein
MRGSDMVVSRPGYVWSGTEWVPIGSPVDASSGIITDHSALTGRSTTSQHPTSAITGLDPALAGKSDTTHTHTGYDVAAGAGISTDNGSPNVITNTDRGTDAVTDHVAEADPHAGGYSLPDHLHTGTYADTTHTHSYDVLGAADNAVQAHVADNDPHVDYLLSSQVIPGPGIAVQDNGPAGILVTAVSQGGIVPVVGIAVGQSQNRNVANITWFAPRKELILLQTMDAAPIIDGSPNGILFGPNAPAGWYQAIYSCAFAGNVGGTVRAIRMTVNGVVANSPLCPRLNMTPLAASSITIVPATGVLLGKPGDRIAFECFQNSGATLATDAGDTFLALLYMGPEASPVVP